ncbi:phosphate acyltransferase, partial [Paenibacillus sepulcri]|nr:phosphate acyltransferase [Paenibacillus sepulcri]
MRIAIDAMGGDHAPELIVKGALEAALEWPDTKLLLVGDTVRIKEHIAGALPSNVTIVHAEDVIGPDEEPVKAVRRKKEASMVVAGRLVREGEAEAMLSAGNTGALMTTGLLVVGRIEGIERPALVYM